jgi:hypothetical protein
MFHIPAKGYIIRVIASTGLGWERVSVMLTNNRTTNWKEMCAIKNIFWDPEDCVMQLHPPESRYINDHNHCLHLWRPIDQTIPMPPLVMI